MRPFHTIPLLLLLLSACSGPLTSPDADRGTFVGQWDASRWDGQAYAVLQGDTLFLVAHRPDPRYHYDEYIRAKLQYSGLQSYLIPESAGELAKITGGDAGYFPQAAGTLTLHAHSSQPHRVSGRLVLTADHDGSLWRVDGQFDAPVFSSFSDIPWDRRNRF